MNDKIKIFNNDESFYDKWPNKIIFYCLVRVGRDEKIFKLF